jgi:hypothetical protein
LTILKGAKYVARIFLSFRKPDERLTRDRIYTALSARLGEDRIFKSGPSIPAGTNYRQALPYEAAACEIMVVLIGSAWFGPTGEDGLPHLYRDDDWVRREIAASLNAGNRIIPVLLGEATMLPAPESLPPDIAALGNLQFIRITDTGIDAGIEQLISALLRLQPTLEPAPAATGETPAQAPESTAPAGDAQAAANAQAHQSGQAVSVTGGLGIAVGNDLNAPGGHFVAGDDNSSTVNKKSGGVLGALAGVALGADLDAGKTTPTPMAAAGNAIGAGAVRAIRPHGGLGGLLRWISAHPTITATVGCAVLVGGLACAAIAGAHNSDGTGTSGGDPATATQVAVEPAPATSAAPVITPSTAISPPVVDAADAGFAGIAAAGTDSMTVEDSNQDTWTQTVTFSAPEIGTAPGTAPVEDAMSDCMIGYEGNPSENLVIPFTVTDALTSAEPLTNFQVPVGIGTLDDDQTGSGNILSMQVIDAYSQDGTTQYSCLTQGNSETGFAFDQLAPGSSDTGHFWVVLTDAVNGAGQPDTGELPDVEIQVGSGTVEGSANGPDVCGGSGTPDLLVTGLQPPTASANPSAVDCSFTAGP